MGLVGGGGGEHVFSEPALETLDSCQTSEQVVAGSTPARSAIFFRGYLIMKYFLLSFAPLC